MKRGDIVFHVGDVMLSDPCVVRAVSGEHIWMSTYPQLAHARGTIQQAGTFVIAVPANTWKAERANNRVVAYRASLADCLYRLYRLPLAQGWNLRIDEPDGACVRDHSGLMANVKTLAVRHMISAWRFQQLADREATE